MAYLGSLDSFITEIQLNRPLNPFKNKNIIKLKENCDNIPNTTLSTFHLNSRSGSIGKKCLTDLNFPQQIRK